METGLYAIAIITVYAFAITFLVRYLKNWNKTHPLTLEAYLMKYPNAKTSDGIVCGICGSKSLRNLGASYATDKRRLVSCNSCASALYHAKH